MTADIIQDGTKILSLSEVTIERKPGWTVVRSTRPYSTDIRVFAKDVYDVKEAES